MNTLNILDFKAYQEAKQCIAKFEQGRKSLQATRRSNRLESYGFYMLTKANHFEVLRGILEKTKQALSNFRKEHELHMLSDTYSADIWEPYYQEESDKFIKLLFDVRRLLYKIQVD